MRSDSQETCVDTHPLSLVVTPLNISQAMDVLVANAHKPPSAAFHSIVSNIYFMVDASMQ